MLASIDQELFPDDCEVVEMPLHNQWIYLIQKNGSSSLKNLSRSQSLKTYRNQEIGNLSTVDVYVRDPRSRYVSGVNTFVKMLFRKNPELDYQTSIWFATRYNFLNRHYLPQFHWIANLSRFLADDCRLRFHSMNQLRSVVSLDSKPAITPTDQQLIDLCQSLESQMEIWYYVDQILLDLAGQQLTWQDLKSHYQQNHPNAWAVLTQHHRFQNVLS